MGTVSLLSCGAEHRLPHPVLDVSATAGFLQGSGLFIDVLGTAPRPPKTRLSGQFSVGLSRLVLAPVGRGSQLGTTAGRNMGCTVPQRPRCATVSPGSCAGTAAHPCSSQDANQELRA